MQKIHCPELDNHFNWDKLYSLNPKDIKWALTTNSWFDVCKDEWFKVYDGDWDTRLEIEKDFVYSSIYAMFKNNIRFQETELYKTTLNQILQGQNRWGCKNEQDLKWREGQLRNIYAYINTYGFKTQDELEQEGHITVKLRGQNVDDPGVIIDRDGRLLYHNANHRLPMFQILDIPEIKVKINVRHKEWVEFLLFVKKIAQQMWGKNKIYQPVNHIDFDHYTIEWSDYRFKLINHEIKNKVYSFPNKIPQLTILDVGALWGYFSSSFEKEGHICTAVETNKDFVYIMDKLRIANDQSFTILNQNVLELQDLKYDIVLALNIFHHFLKTEQTFQQFALFLQRLDIKDMYFQSHQTTEAQMQGVHKNFESQEFVDYILQNSCLNYSQEIGSEKGRKIYKLWR